MTGPDVTATLVLWLDEARGGAPMPEDALARAGVQVWALPGDATARELVALAPDLVVLAGASAARGPALVRELADERPMGVVPVAVLGRGSDPEGAAAGIVTRIAASPRADELATAIAGVITELERSEEAEQTLDARGIEQQVAALVAERRAAVLLRGSPPGAVAIAADGRRAAALGARGEGSSVVRIYERAPGKLAVLGPSASSGEARDSAADLAGISALVIDDGMADWEGVARALEEGGAKVTLADAERGAIEEARSRDPALVVVATSVLATPAGLLVCQDPRLASASLLVVREDPRAELDPARVVGAARQLCAGEIAPRARALSGAPIVERIEALGVVRWLKTYADGGMAARLRLRSVAGVGEIRLEGGKIREARFEPSDGSAAVEGGAAARALLSLRRGTILAAPLDAPLHERARPGVVAAPADGEAGRADEEVVACEVPAVAVTTGAPASLPAAPEPVIGRASTRAPRRRSIGALTAGIAAAAAAVAVAAYGWSARPEGVGEPASETVFATPPRGAPRAEPAPAEHRQTEAPAADALAAAGPSDDAPLADARPSDAPAPAVGAAEPTTSDPPIEPPAGVSATRLVLQADEALRRRAYAEALALAEQALAIDPRHPRATYDRALSLLRLGRPDEALEAAARAAQLDREEPLYPLLVGDIHQQYGRRARARAVWRACNEAHPEFEPCQRRLARAEAR